MTVPDVQLLTLLTEKYPASARLTPSERKEVIHIAQGFATKDSATADGRALETIRSRRKRLYAKLGVSGASDLVSVLLALSLEMLARGERLGLPGAPGPSVQPTEPAELRARRATNLMAPPAPHV